MTRCPTFSWLCLCVAFCAAATCKQLPTCRPSRRAAGIPSVPACRQFVKLLEDPQYCSLDQTQNCCVVLSAALANHCQCWKDLSAFSLDLLKLLFQHCGHEQSKAAPQALDVKVFIGVLTSAAHAEQREAGKHSVQTYARQHGYSFAYKTFM